MEEKTLFKLARAITDTGTDTVSSKGGTVTYRITSLKRKLVNGKLSGVIGVGYSASSDTPILSSRFNPTKKYPLDLNFYWVAPIYNTCIKIISQL